MARVGTYVTFHGLLDRTHRHGISNDNTLFWFAWRSQVRTGKQLKNNLHHRTASADWVTDRKTAELPTIAAQRFRQVVSSLSLSLSVGFRTIRDVISRHGRERVSSGHAHCATLRGHFDRWVGHIQCTPSLRSVRVGMPSLVTDAGR